jgi:hypothetical protein
MILTCNSAVASLMLSRLFYRCFDIGIYIDSIVNTVETFHTLIKRLLCSRYDIAEKLSLNNTLSLSLSLLTCYKNR